MKTADGRVVVWFSCGAASAVAAKLAVEKYSYVEIVYCNTLASEHPDNMRFLKDIEKWIGQSITIISSKVYNTIEDVFDKRKYMSGIAGAPCTVEMKKIPRFDFQRPCDLHIFGLTSDEYGRIQTFKKNNPELDFDWILQERNIYKDKCFKILKDAGIWLPVMYALGFKNNNCIGCVKATSAVYWQRVRKHFPEIYKRRAEQSRRIGARLVRFHGERMFLDELPIEESDLTPEQDIECGVICIKENNVL